MADIYAGPERRQADLEAQIKKAVSEAVADALKGANLIDGPTHIVHHQAIEEWMAAKRWASKAAITVFVTGVLGLLVLGIKQWVGK